MTSANHGGVPTPLARELFPVTEQYVYLNHAATAVLPGPTREAVRTFIDAQSGGGIARTFPFEAAVGRQRAAVARFIGAAQGTIALLRNTTDGATVLAQGLRWEAGDEVLLPDNEFPANVYPWIALRDRGVNVRFIESAKERLTPDVLRARITPRTRVVTVSWVSFGDGYRHDLEGLADVAHEHGALLCVDAIQGLGAFPIDVTACGVDALYSGGQKWLLALQGIAFLYVRAEVLDRLQVAMPGWRSVENMWNFLDYEQPAARDASRFETGTPNFLGAVSLEASIELLAAAGTEAIAAHVLELTDRLDDDLRSAGALVASVRGAPSSGIVTFTLPGVDPVELGKALQREGIVTTYRPEGVRASPHGYNTFNEIDALAEAVRRYSRKVLSCSQ